MCILMLRPVNRFQFRRQTFVLASAIRWACLASLSFSLEAAPPPTLPRPPLYPVIDAQGVAFGNGIFVAVGANGCIQTSADGIAWARIDAGTRAMLSGITFGQGKFIAVGNQGAPDLVIMSSPDGTNWTQRLADAKGGLSRVAFGNGRFVAVGTRSFNSVDGEVWSETHLDAGTSLKDVVFGSGKFVAVGYIFIFGATYTNLIMTSTNGVNWISQNPDTSLCSGVTFGHGSFVTVCEFGVFLTSPDGVAWTARRDIKVSNSGNRWDFKKVTVGGDLFVAVAGGEEGTKIFSSRDGLAWTERYSASLRFPLA